MRRNRISPPEAGVGTMRFSTKMASLLTVVAMMSVTFQGCVGAARRFARAERVRQSRYACGTQTTASSVDTSHRDQEYFPQPIAPSSGEPELFPGTTPRHSNEPTPSGSNRSDEIPPSTDPMPLFEQAPPTRSASAIPLPPRDGRLL
ncbi:MAG: hypothetical protein R3C01_09825 [Planctomycetaceae bacterium]